jgi:hypothetical protein
MRHALCGWTLAAACTLAGCTSDGARPAPFGSAGVVPVDPHARTATGTGAVERPATSALRAPLPAAASPASIRWSKDAATPSPAGGVQLHGPFNNDTITLTCDGLGAHDWLDLSLDLVIIRTWDGAVDIGPGDEPSATGPDYFSLALDGGPTLLYTTFSNLAEDVFDDASRYQGFPSFVPGDRLPAKTGAAATNTLGYDFTRSSTGVTYKMDTTYRLHFLVPHHAAAATFELAAMNLQEPEDEGWAVANVTVRPLAAAAVRPPADAALAQAFAAGVDAKAPGGPDAFTALVAGRDATVRWIAANVAPKPLPAAAAGLAQKVVNGDESSRFETQRTLIECGPQVEVLLRDAYKAAPATGRGRIDSALVALGVQTIADDGLRRVMLATRVLEVIGTPDALALRRKLVGQ